MRNLGKAIVAGAIAGLLTLGLAESAAAGQQSVSHFWFYGCTGPGVPASFEGVKTLLPDAASHPVSAASAFVVVGAPATYTVYDFGFGAPKGIDVSGVATDWCWVDFAGIGPTLVGGAYHGG